jgi:hypothetical protein
MGQVTAFVGQVKYGHRQRWMNVSRGGTLLEAAHGAAQAFCHDTDVDGRLPQEVRILEGVVCAPPRAVGATDAPW